VYAYLLVFEYMCVYMHGREGGGRGGGVGYAYAYVLVCE
jgi:hypothetical protein